MRHDLEYLYQVTLESGYGESLGSYTDLKRLRIDEDLQDIFEYNFQIKYDKQYNPLSWYLEPNSKELYKELEELWKNNNINTHKLYIEDYAFQEFLKEKYASQVSGLVERDVIKKIKTNYIINDGVIYFIEGEYLYIDGAVQE